MQPGRGGGSTGLQPLELLRGGDALSREHPRSREVVGGALAVRLGGTDLGGADGGGLGERAPLLDQRRETGLLEDGDGVSSMHRIALILEQPVQSARREGTEPDFANLDCAGDGQRVAGSGARHRADPRGER